MAKRRGHDGRRDKYGRFKAKSGGIKAYKSNLPVMKAGTRRKKAGPIKVKVSFNNRNISTDGWSKKKKIAAGALAVGAAAVYGYQVHQKLSQINGTDRRSRRVPASAEVRNYAAKVSRGAPTGQNFQNKTPFQQNPSAKQTTGSKLPGKSTPTQSVKYIDDKSISKANAIVKRYTAGDKTISWSAYDKAQVHLAQADTIAQGHVYKGIKRRK